MKFHQDISMQCSSFIATSLDGFIAKTDGSLDWLNAANATVPEGEDCGYAQYMAGVEVILMGRKTFETVLSFGAWPYDKPVYVVSHQWSALPAAAPATAQLWKDSLPALCTHLAASGVRAAYVDGGQLIQSFINAQLLDKITITRIPVLLGSGLPLFGPLADGTSTVTAQHLQTRSFEFGFVQSDYRLEYAAAGE
jgi:dihydrofolate reductase